MQDTIYKSIAIVLLAHSDYESLELSLAAHSKFTNKKIDFFILQNGRGSYDCERTLAVAKRYANLFPSTIRIIEDISPAPAYVAIKKLLSREDFEKYKYIIKIDDDVMPITYDWVQKLSKCYFNSFKEVGNNLAYVTPLINNNAFGFSKFLELFSLENDYFNNLAREHLIGNNPYDSYSPFRIISKDKISTDAFGTIWRYAYLARWVHEQSSLHPDLYIKLTENAKYININSKERYSINCIMFNKNLWYAIDDNISQDDEHLLHKYCLLNNKYIVADLSIPMIHLFFFIQRHENRDILNKMKEVYSDWLGLNFPISLTQDRLMGIEDRLRFMEAKLDGIGRPFTEKIIEKLKNKCKQYVSPHNKLYIILKFIYKKVLKG
ncbi:MAG: hypothetical protein HDT39_16610 [Lachnospiraceae bacterium]|nr:hypothetical protein [Lachnospiraceae bacterium]